jgi:hypothetical protein
LERLSYQPAADRFAVPVTNFKLKGLDVDQSPSRGRILLAQDDIATALELTALREAGFQVVSPALQARDAIELIEANPVEAAVIVGLAQSSMHEVLSPARPSVSSGERRREAVRAPFRRSSGVLGACEP